MFEFCRLKDFAVCLLLCCLIGAAYCFAEEASVFGFDDNRAPWHIEADTIQARDRNQYSASGRVLVTKGDKQVSADVIRFDGDKQEIVASGNVKMTAGEGVLSGERMEMNLEAETGTIYGGKLSLRDSHFHVAGDRIEKVGPETYRANKFRLTTCDPADPDWYLSGRDLSFTIEGYGSMRHAAFWAKKIPLLYVPYLFFPVKTKRQTGLLVPQMDYSRENGGQYAQPFFWAINNSSDMTLFGDYMSRRGVRLGAEYRQVFSEKSKIIVMADGLKDRQTNMELDGDYGYEGDAWIRPNADRYWFRMKGDLALPRDVSARLDIDVVSDQDYLKEFDDGYMGFDDTDASFEDVFGRDLDEAEETVRTNNVSLNRIWAQRSFNAALRWEDDIIKRRWEDKDETVQRLPILMFNAARQYVPGTPFECDQVCEYTFGFRRDGIKGHRADLHPRVYLPLHWRRFVFIEPSAGIRKTFWWMDEPDPAVPLMDRSPTRTVYDLEMDLSSEFCRIFTLSRENDTRIKHALIPRATYRHVVSPDDGESFPVFDDSLDRINEERLITYSLENVFVLRTAVGSADVDTDEIEHCYREVCRFNIEQSYDVKEAREEDPSAWKNGVSRRPFSPILVELDFKPINNLMIDLDAGWNKYDRRWSEYNIEANLFDHRGDALYVAYRYDRDVAESVYAEASLVVSPSLTLYAEHEHNYFDHIDIETSVGCLYTAGCWSLDIHFTDEPDDDKISVMVGLRGLSDMKSGSAVKWRKWSGM